MWPAEGRFAMRMAAHCGCPETDSFSDRAITNLDVAEESENEAWIL